MLTKEIIFDLMNDYTKGVDTYNHNGSTWLIFTDSKKWVIELTKEKTLWYNYYFFTGVFKYLSLDVVENQHYITKWVEDNVINGVKDARALEEWVNSEKIVDKTIQNGVKVTYSDKIPHQYDWTNQFTDEIEDIIENGVKHTEYGDWEDGDERLDDIIKNGIKETKDELSQRTWMSQQVIENGVKETKSIRDGDIMSTIKWLKENNTENVPEMIDDIIDNGIKKTEGGVLFDESKIDTVISEGIKEIHDDVMPHTGRVEGVIKNGVKECVPVHHTLYNPMDFSVVYRENLRIDDVASVLENGIKEVQPLPSQEGNKDWGDYYHRQEDRTKPHTKYVDDVITNGKKISEN